MVVLNLNFKFKKKNLLCPLCLSAVVKWPVGSLFAVRHPWGGAGDVGGGGGVEGTNRRKDPEGWLKMIKVQMRNLRRQGGQVR